MYYMYVCIIMIIIMIIMERAGQKEWSFLISEGELGVSKWEGILGSLDRGCLGTEVGMCRQQDPEQIWTEGPGE